MNAFQYLEPQSVDEAVRLLAEKGGRARLLAGGTDLIIQMEMGRHSPEVVLSPQRISELREITWDPAHGLRIGATATLREVENHSVVVEKYPALARGAKEVGSVQIRNLATLAGNVCNASPSADTSPALLGYDASVEIAGPGGRRAVPVADFWTGPGQCILEDGEMVPAILLPPPPDGQRSFYYKLAVRKAMDLAMVGLCVTLVPGGGGSASNVRIAVGAAAPTCFRASEAEAAVEAGGRSAIDRAAALAEAAVRPIDDQRASAAYRREMVRVLTARALTQLLA